MKTGDLTRKKCTYYNACMRIQAVKSRRTFFFSSFNFWYRNAAQAGLAQFKDLFWRHFNNAYLEKSDLIPQNPPTGY